MVIICARGEGKCEKSQRPEAPAADIVRIRTSRILRVSNDERE